MMQKYIIIFFLIIASAISIAMDKDNIAQVKKMEAVRRIFRNRSTLEMSTESSQADDEMSFSSSSSGSFPIPIPKEVIQEKSSNFVISKHGYSPRQRESSLKKLLQGQDAEK